jgi:signal transduction histidine kinase
MSFIVLSSIITTTIRGYVTESKETSLIQTSQNFAALMSYRQVEDIERFVHSGLGEFGLSLIMNTEKNMKMLIADPNGRIILSTVKMKEVNGFKQPVTFEDGELGTINFELFESENEEEDYLLYNGKMDSIGSENFLICAVPVVTNDNLIGYSVSLMSTSREDNLVYAARQTIVSSSFWVMLSAVVAVYFITERVINPLKNMTKATKSFAKGDFSTRVTVSGKDEIATLGEAFNNMAESLDNFEKMRNSFLANVSHDLRTPMTTIAGFIDGITSGAIPPEKHEYYLNIISEEVHRLSRLVADLLDISRLESGERKFNFVAFDIAEMARIILISFEQKIGEKDLDVSFDSDSDSIFVTADKDAIHQVLYNLMHNAIKFSRVGGKLAIGLHRVANKKVTVSVYDEGQGIAQEDISLVFDRFYKTDKSRGLDKSGVGLGLYICKTIMDAHSEKIWVESEYGKNCEFFFTLSRASHGA